MIDSAKSVERPILLPDAPVLVAGIKTVIWLNVDGEIKTFGKEEATEHLQSNKPYWCTTYSSQD